MKTYSIAWWNLENLFDIAGAPHRTEKLERTLASELRGWTEAIVDQKIQNLAAIIRQFNGGRGPDLLGVCEVESRPVLDRLVTALRPLRRRYRVAHFDTSDQRGIDVAFIYDAALFSTTKRERFAHVVIKRAATRELVQVNFRTASGGLLVVIGNHWPSRTGGQHESEPYRIIAGETLSYFCQRIQEIHGKEAAILVMGDFNDEPFNRALTDYALSCGDPTRVVHALNPMLVNLMWPEMGAGRASFYFGNAPLMLDHFLVSKGMLNSGAKLRVKADSATAARFPEMMSSGRYPAAIRFGRPSSQLNLAGFSDHYPITMSVEED
jgi:endonuclease/exonuclease/phosphatase family metal-dependent hydrolase